MRLRIRMLPDEIDIMPVTIALMSSVQSQNCVCVCVCMRVHARTHTHFSVLWIMAGFLILIGLFTEENDI